MALYCSCGKEAVLITSWTPKNPGRRFWGCPVKGSSCPFIKWFDPKMCPRSVQIIPGLLKSKNAAEQEARKLKKYLILSWVGFILFLIAMKM